VVAAPVVAEDSVVEEAETAEVGGWVVVADSVVAVVDSAVDVVVTAGSAVERVVAVGQTEAQT
jgi:hypothetical protein